MPSYQSVDSFSVTVAGSHEHKVLQRLFLLVTRHVPILEDVLFLRLARVCLPCSRLSCQHLSHACIIIAEVSSKCVVVVWFVEGKVEVDRFGACGSGEELRLA
jgi:hypothetical protein